MDPDGRGDPVSVTPPRTWRRAAWFAVGASCVALTALVVGASQLAGRSGSIVSFPGLPTGGLLTAQPLGPPVHPPGPATTVPGGHGPGGTDGPSGGIAGGEPGGGPRGDGRAGGPAETWTASSRPGRQSGASIPPSVTIMPTTGQPAVSADELVAGTTQFYDQLPSNLNAAWAMLSPRAKKGGFDSFREQWADTEQVHLQQVIVDADDSSVLATVQTVTTDGVEHVRQFRLGFVKSHPLTIDEISP